MTFDGPNKLVILSSVTLDLPVFWSAWKDWLLAGNAGYALALDTVGGEPIDPTAGTLVPLYLFIRNGWKIRPMEADHTLRVTNGSLVVSGGGDPFVSTVGDFTVRVVYQQPVQAFGYSTTGGSGATPAEIWSYGIRTLTTSLPDVPTAEENAAATIAALIEGGLSVRDVLRLVLAVTAGDATGLEGSNMAFKSLDGTKNRVEATYAAGDRTVTARDAS